MTGALAESRMITEAFLRVTWPFSISLRQTPRMAAFSSSIVERVTVVTLLTPGARWAAWAPEPRDSGSSRTWTSKPSPVTALRDMTS